MLSEKLLNAINDQINFEIHSALIYKAMQAYFESEDLPGMANWMDVQFQEEMSHAEKMFHFVCEAGGRVKMLAMEEPCNDYSSPLDAFEKALAHEKIVTGRINNLMDIAIDERNHAAQIFLQWFVTEQVEEEASAGYIIAQLNRIQEDGRGLMMLDKDLGSRTFEPIAAE
ncbi:ferritin [Malonomonas rubra DSM 5091]|uniref:Ferritin n=1 Tax=Malonomonas rubra DSM 5091 TaxID=1122189 RepID=A0A1M6GL73_MALRU|nr:ferritin [Malonomonas rubra]SHJ10616.1 ferritin [Malonomonas rubra DSM 5091]